MLSRFPLSCARCCHHRLGHSLCGMCYIYHLSSPSLTDSVSMSLVFCSFAFYISAIRVSVFGVNRSCLALFHRDWVPAIAVGALDAARTFDAIRVLVNNQASSKPRLSRRFKLKSHICKAHVVSIFKKKCIGFGWHAITATYARWQIRR